MNVLLYVDDLLFKYFGSDLMGAYFFPLLALAFLATVPRLIRTFFCWR